MHLRSIPVVFVLCSVLVSGQGAEALRARYEKDEVRIRMRDGVELCTAIYRPRGEGGPWPIMLHRTPYGIGPYGKDAYRDAIAPSIETSTEGYLFVHQDVRGRFQSGGVWKPMTPHRAVKSGPTDIDESSDTFDTIDWLVKNVPGNNGRVGMWGISYPGFYAAAGAIDAHPALVAVSPQAPAIDMFVGDDFHHHGAFFLAHAFRWLSSNARPRTGLTTERPPVFTYPTEDGYRFFLELGPISNIEERYLKGTVPIWNDFFAHPDYDDYWKAQNLLPHLKRIRPAVMTVGGWFDSEDLYGPLASYRGIERESPDNAHNVLVMGPWIHGGWARQSGDRLAAISFGSKTAEHYRARIEAVWFREHLKGEGRAVLSEATVFATGENVWRSYDAWPPKDATKRALYLGPAGSLVFDSPGAVANAPGFDEYVNDPRRPVPFTAEIRPTMGHEFMIEDQRFAWVRPDVLSYETPRLTEDVRVVGPITARLFVETSGTDADYVVKLIDVLPDETPPPEPNPTNARLGGYQMLVRGEVMRARYRKSYEKPEALVPGQVTEIAFALQDVCHTFKAGHRIMVQVQSSWFPLVDRNPQRFVNLFTARPEDFQSARHRVYRTPDRASRLEITVASKP